MVINFLLTKLALKVAPNIKEQKLIEALNLDNKGNGLAFEIYRIYFSQCVQRTLREVVSWRKSFSFVECFYVVGRYSF